MYPKLILLALLFITNLLWRQVTLWNEEGHQVGCDGSAVLDLLQPAERGRMGRRAEVVVQRLETGNAFHWNKT